MLENIALQQVTNNKLSGKHIRRWCKLSSTSIKSCIPTPPPQMRHSVRWCPKSELWLICPMYPVDAMLITWSYFYTQCWGGGGVAMSGLGQAQEVAVSNQLMNTNPLPIFVYFRKSYMLIFNITWVWFSFSSSSTHILGTCISASPINNWNPLVISWPDNVSTTHLVAVLWNIYTCIYL